MASQLLLAMPSTPVPDVELTSEQSLALVKVFVNASLACICHTRELLNWSSDCFRKRFIDDISLDHDVDYIYDVFCRIESPSTKPSQEVRVLVRSDNSRANGILDLMEFGVFDALKCSYLDILHVFVTSDAKMNDPILETYTYTFEYQDSHVTSVRMGETGRSFSLANSQKSFKAAIRALLRTMKELPILPKRLSLGMSMSFRAECPPDYQPAGFRNAEQNSIAVDDWKTLWQTPSTVVTSFKAAHHVVKIAARNKEYEEQTTSQLQDTLMSKRLHNMQRTSSNRNIGLRSTMPVPTTPGRNPQNKASLQQPSKRAREEDASKHAEQPQADSVVKTSQVKQSPRRRKISISGRFIDVNRSSPASRLSCDEDDHDADRASPRSGQTDWSGTDFD